MLARIDHFVDGVICQPCIEWLVLAKNAFDASVTNQYRCVLEFRVVIVLRGKVLGAMNEEGSHVRQNVSVTTLTRDGKSPSRPLKVYVLQIDR